MTSVVDTFLSSVSHLNFDIDIAKKQTDDIIAQLRENSSKQRAIIAASALLIFAGVLATQSLLIFAGVSAILSFLFWLRSI